MRLLFLGTLLYWGPVYPNFAAFCTIPAVASVFIWFMQGFDERRSVCLADRPVLVAMLFGLASLVVLAAECVIHARYSFSAFDCSLLGGPI